MIGLAVFVTFLQTLSEVQGFSVWGALRNAFLAALAFVGALLALLLLGMRWISVLERLW